ncbi:aminodeoxychorismate synthase component I, partial [Acinetobacter pittii]
MSQLKKKISLYSKNAADILKKLDGLTGLIYLNDNNNPTIGFLPQDYIIIQNENYLEFERQNFKEYKHGSKSNQLLNFIQFKENNLNKDIESTTSFMGGYIGFISYDFSAHQFINGQNHIQPSLF